MIAVLAALALAGAPANTPVTCSPVPLPGGAWGQTHFETRPVSITFYGPVVCEAQAFVEASPTQRFLMVEREPDLARTVGEGLLVTVHEAEHVGMRDLRECPVEKAAFAHLPAMVDLLDGWLPSAEADATTYHEYLLQHGYGGC